jgi:hypothetical protein
VAKPWGSNHLAPRFGFLSWGASPFYITSGGGKTVTEQQQIELGKRLVQGDCLRIAGQDLAAGMQASEILLSIESDDWIKGRAIEHEGMQKTLATLDKVLDKHRGVRLSIEDELKKQRTNSGTTIIESKKV